MRSRKEGVAAPDPAQMQALLALMRMRQQQEQLREQTSRAGGAEGYERAITRTTRRMPAKQQGGAARRGCRRCAQDPALPGAAAADEAY